jgi:adenylate kinase
MRIILLGAPGAGKGTLAEMLVASHHIVQISTGDILRNAVNTGTAIGKQANEFMARGELVPDSIIMEIMKDRLQQDDCKDGFILDGFPRTIYQAKALEEILSKLGIEIDAVINLEVPEDIIMRRLTSRRTCSNTECQAIYNIYTMPSKIEGICDKCGSPTVQRDDETEEVIKRRLETYEEKTAPLIEYYRGDSRFISVSALDARSVYDKIIERVGR